MKFLIFLIAFTSASAFAGQNLRQESLFFTKAIFEKKAYDLKILNEQALMKIIYKESFDLHNETIPNANYDCIEWVYKGPSSREEALRACKGVTNMNCVEFVYKGPSTREESAMACKNVHDMKCVEFIYKGAATRVEAARSCANERPDGCYDNY